MTKMAMMCMMKKKTGIGLINMDVPECKTGKENHQETYQNAQMQLDNIKIANVAITCVYMCVCMCASFFFGR